MNKLQTMALLGLVVSVLGMLPLGAQADTVLFQDDFDGTGPLNGTTPDITTGGAAWVAGSGFGADGTVATTRTTATLAFTPETNKLYRLQARISSTASWIGFGFAKGQSVLSGQRNKFTGQDTVGKAWVMKKGDADTAPNGNQTQKNAAIQEQDFPGDFYRSLADMDFRIDLNTSNAIWTATWYGKLTTDSEYTLFRAEENLGSQNIDSIGFASNIGTGMVANLSLSVLSDDTAAADAAFVGIESVSNDLFALTIDAVPPLDRYTVLGSPSLTSESWAQIPHSDDPGGPFVLTNLNHSVVAPDGSNVVVYVSFTNTVGFVGIEF